MHLRSTLKGLLICMTAAAMTQVLQLQQGDRTRHTCLRSARKGAAAERKQRSRPEQLKSAGSPVGETARFLLP